MRKNVAKTLVFLVNTKEATTLVIERRTDLRQPEVSIATKYLTKQGWIKRRKTPAGKKGRPIWRYTLAVPVPEIIGSIEKQKGAEVMNQLVLIRKIRNYL